MDVLTQQIMQQMSGDSLEQVSRQIGTNEQATTSLLEAALPVLVSALAKNASQPTEAQALHQALAEDHDGSILNNLSGFLSNPDVANGAAILGHILGPKEPVVNQGLAQASNLNADQVAQLMQIAAPLVMGALGKEQQQNGFSTSDLSAFLGTQQQIDEAARPNLMQTLNVILDFDHDGSAIDDVMNMVSKLFGNR
jgi:hypothetical protein